MKRDPIESGQVRSGDATIEYEVRRSRRRRKTVEIRLDGGRVAVAAPTRTTAEEIAALVLKRAAWILKHRAEELTRAAPRRSVSGESVPYLGRDVRVVAESSDGEDASVRLAHGLFEVRVPDELSGEDRRERVSDAFERWFRARAEERIPARVVHWSQVTGLQPTGVLIRNQRRRWGSCGADGTLRFNWRLVLAAPALLDYVVVHELAHLAVRNHSADFWQQVEEAMPDHLERRAALRAIGPRLTL